MAAFVDAVAGSNGIAFAGTAGLDDPYAFVTSAGRTQCAKLVNSRVACAAPLGDDVLVTVISRGGGQRFEVSGSALFTRAADPAAPAPCRMYRVNASSLKITQAPGALRAVPPPGFAEAPRPGSQHSQHEGGLCQRWAATTDGTVTTTLTGGHCMLASPWFAGGRPVGSGLWQRYVDRAVIVTELGAGRAPTDKATLDALLAVTLQAVAGVYDRERADDRGCVDIKFGRNSDCDDEAVSACALAVAAKAEHAHRAHLSPTAKAVLGHLKTAYGTPVLIAGNARDPKHISKAPFGHCWAALLVAGSSSFRGALHIEATAPMVPTPVPSPRVMQLDAYNQALATCNQRRKALGLKGNAIVGARVLDRRFYTQAIAAYTATAMYTWPGTPAWTDVLAGGHEPTAVARQGGGHPPHHRPDRTRHFPDTYNPVPPRHCRVAAPAGWLGILSANLDAKADDPSTVVDPFNVMIYVTGE